MSSTRDRLVEAAFEIFGRNGFHAVGLDRILDEVGVSKQTFYNHFESKDELILAVLDRRHQLQSQWWTTLLNASGGNDPRKKLYALFDVLDAWFNEPDWRGCIFMTAAAEFPSPTDLAHQKAAEHTRKFQDYLQYLATLAGADDPKSLAEQLAVLLDGVISYRHVTADPRSCAIGRMIGHRLLEDHLPDPTASAIKPTTITPSAVA